MPDRNDLVVKHNDLIPCLSKMSLQELRLLSFCLAHLDSRADVELKPCTASAQEMADIFEMAPDGVYYVVKKAMLSINAKPAQYKEADENVIAVWFTTLKHNTSKGTFTFRMNEELKPRLIGLKENFTQFRLREVYQFSSAATWKMYEVLRQWKKAGRVDFLLDDFRWKIGIAGMYPRLADIKRHIIEPAIAEINKYSDIKIQWERVLEGRRSIKGVRFFIVENLANKPREEKIRDTLKKTFEASPLNAAPELAERLAKEFKLTETEARSWANQLTDCQERVNTALDGAARKAAAGKITGSLPGYACAILKNILKETTGQ